MKTAKNTFYLFFSFIYFELQAVPNSRLPKRASLHADELINRAISEEIKNLLKTNDEDKKRNIMENLGKLLFTKTINSTYGKPYFYTNQTRLHQSHESICKKRSSNEDETSSEELNQQKKNKII